MTVRIFKDVEEAIAREVRRITFHDPRTVDTVAFREVFDVLTGEIVQIPIEPSFYDSSADTGHIDYPHFFIQLKKTREDRFSGREVPNYGKECLTPILTSPKAFEIVLYLGDGTVAAAGNDIGTSTYKIRRIEAEYLVRIFTGANAGTYTVSSITVDAGGSHTITLSDSIVTDLSELNFNTTTRVVTFLEPKDIATVKIGDTFNDAVAGTFLITALDAPNMQITLDGVAAPDLTSGGTITRSGDILELDAGPFVFSVMDPSRPITAPTLPDNSTQFLATNAPVPLDLFYQVRIDSKEKDDHTAIANRIWEEFFNPPRTALPVIVRSKLSADQDLITDVSGGGSNTIEVTSNTNYSVGEEVFIFNNFSPTKSASGGFQEPFTAKVVDKISNTQLVLDKIVPDTFTVLDKTKVVSNAEFRLYMFHFVDHATRDVEGSQYWVHEFQAIVQVWIDRQGDPSTTEGPIQDISTPIEDLDGNIILC